MSTASLYHLPFNKGVDIPSRMEPELDEISAESGEFSFGQRDMSLDVKLAFARVCSLIDALPATKASMQLLRKIQREAKAAMQLKRSEPRPNETHLLNITAQPLPDDESLFPVRASRGSHFNSYRDPQSSSFFAKRQRINHSSILVNDDNEATSFRPIKKGPAYDTDQSSLDPIEEDEEIAPSSVDLSSSLDSESIRETLGDSETYTLKKWSVKKVNNNMHLTGVKLDRKGNIIEREFISEKILSRPECDVVRTADGDFLLQEPLTDPKKIIPEEVRNTFLKEKYFPKQWRRALFRWAEIENKTQVSEPKAENDRSTSNKVNKKDSTADNKNKTPKVKKTPREKVISSGKKTTGGKKTPTAKKTPTGRKRPYNKKNSSLGESSATKDNNKNVSNQNQKNTAVKVQKTGNNKVNSSGKSNIESTDKPPKKPRKKKEEGNKKKEINDTSGPQNQKSVEKKPEEEEEDAILSDHDVLRESDGESVCLLPKTSLTPSGLLASIKKQQIKGRFTPPTDIFDRVYGHSSPSNSSVVNNTFDNPSKKNINVMKRLAKARNATKTQKKKEAGFDKKIVEDEEHKLIDDIIRASQLKTTTTPPLIKEVFRKDMSLDESDVETESSIH